MSGITSAHIHIWRRTDARLKRSPGERDDDNDDVDFSDDELMLLGNSHSRTFSCSDRLFSTIVTNPVVTLYMTHHTPGTAGHTEAEWLS